MQFQKFSQQESVVVTPLKGREGQPSNGWFIMWHDTLGGPDNISAGARDALLHLLQTRDMTRIAKLRLKVRRKR